MEIKNIDGNLLDSEAQLILQQVNCSGAMNSGVAKAIREKWPVVYEKYKDFVMRKCDGELLGYVQPVTINDNQKVFNLFGQHRYGYDGERYTSYDAIDSCLKKTADYCVEHNVASIALPWHMSCDRGGANWNIIMEMIKQHFEKLDITIEIWKLK